MFPGFSVYCIVYPTSYLLYQGHEAHNPKSPRDLSRGPRTPSPAKRAPRNAQEGPWASNVARTRFKTPKMAPRRPKRAPRRPDKTPRGPRRGYEAEGLKADRKVTEAARGHWNYWKG